MVRAPCGVVIGQYGQAGYGAGVAVIQAVVVGEHALGKVGVSSALHLYVDVDPAFLAGGELHAHQRVGKAFAQFSVANDLAQFGVFEFVAFGPVDLSAGLGKVEGHEFGESVFDHVFPRAVVVVGGQGLCVSHGLGPKPCGRPRTQRVLAQWL